MADDTAVSAVEQEVRDSWAPIHEMVRDLRRDSDRLELLIETMCELGVDATIRELAEAVDEAERVSEIAMLDALYEEEG
jgi:hypothetical protein